MRINRSQITSAQWHRSYVASHRASHKPAALGEQCGQAPGVRATNDGTKTSFDTEVRWQLLKECQHIAPLELTAKKDRGQSGRIYPLTCAPLNLLWRLPRPLIRNATRPAPLDTDHDGGPITSAGRFSPLGHQLIPLNSTSINRVFGYFLRKARRASLRPAENPPSSASGLSLKNEAISPPLSSKMRTDIRTPDPLLPMKIPNTLPETLPNCLSRSAFAWRGLAPIQTVRRRYAVTM